MVDLPKGIDPFEEEDKKKFSLPKGIAPLQSAQKVSIQDPILVEEDDKGFFESVGDQVGGAGS